MSQHIVITGNVVQGLFFYGPFPTEQAARDFGAEEHPDAFSVAPLASGASDEQVKALADHCIAKDLPEDALDELVHGAASTLGTDANNDGFDGQARFLIEQWGFDAAQAAIEKVERS